MAVACGAELGGKAGEAGADVVCQEHTAALAEAEHLPGLLHQVYGLVHGLRSGEDTLRLTLSAITLCCGILLALRIRKTASRETAANKNR